MALSLLWARLTRVDRWLVLILMLVALVSLWISFGRSVGRNVVIYSGERLVFTAPLSQPRQVGLRGPLGETQIEIQDGKLRVTSSPCPRKICIGMGEIHRSGDLLACVPNQILVRIEGEESSYDLLSR